MADPLIEPFAELCGALRGLQEQVEQLSRVHEAVDDFNSAFGAFQGAMALHASCLTYPKNVPAPTRGHNSLAQDKKQTSPGAGIQLPSNSRVSPDGNGEQNMLVGGKKTADKLSNGELKQMKKKPATGMKRQAKVDSNNTRIKRRKPAPKAAKPAWTWERHIREKIPRKYQSPAELKKLENIVLYLKNRHCAISISDLVKHSGLPVIRCKEILQTLMKLDIIERRREKSVRLIATGAEGGPSTYALPCSATLFRVSSTVLARRTEPCVKSNANSRSRV